MRSKPFERRTNRIAKNTYNIGCHVGRLEEIENQRSRTDLHEANGRLGCMIRRSSETKLSRRQVVKMAVLVRSQESRARVPKGALRKGGETCQEAKTPGGEWQGGPGVPGTRIPYQVPGGNLQGEGGMETKHPTRLDGAECCQKCFLPAASKR